MLEVPVGLLAEWVGAQVIGDPKAMVGPDVVIDSRVATPGCLFVALPGESADGHDFAPAAVAAGAAALLVSHELPLAVPQLIVPEPGSGLAAIGGAVADAAISAGATSIAITGSSGKTSTKDLLAQVLAGEGDTVAPENSFNNEIGVPLTASKATPATRFLITEMGARGAGHLTWLCGVVPPVVGVVVNVGSAHLGEFGSVEAIAEAKGELVEALPADGWAVLNADDPLVSGMAERTSARVATFSIDRRPGWGDLQVWASEVVADSLQRPRFTLHAESAGSPGPPLADGAAVAAVRLQVVGAHQVGNALAAAAVALSQGVQIEAVAAGLSKAQARSRWRMELTERDDGVLVVNDAYNANPDSMSAALRALVALRRPGGRLLAVLGDMLELGPGAGAEHRRAGALAAELGVDAVIALGHHATDLAGGFGAATMLAPDRTIAAAAASAWLRPADVVLVKASRGLGLEVVAEDLSANPGGVRG